MANTYKDIVITPNKSSATDDPKIVFSGANASVNTDITLRVYPDSNGTLSFEGSAGQLFSVTNDLTGSVFSVNDVSGIPLMEVNVASQQITLGQFYGNVGIGTSNAVYKLDVNGDARITGNLTLGDATTDTITVNAANFNLANNVSFDSGTLYIDKTNNRIGIGTTSPSANLHVQAGAAVSTPRGAGQTKMFFTSDAASYAEFQSATTYDLLFSSNSSSNYGMVRYDNPSQTLQLWTGSLERINVSTTQAVFKIGTDFATNDAYVSSRVIRNATTSGAPADGMYIGYGNGNSGYTRIFSAGSSTNYYYSDASGNILRNDGSYYLHNTSPVMVTVAESLRANKIITGGGTITYDGSGNLLWSDRFIVISNGRGTNFGTDGYFSITCPTSGTITGVGGASNQTATAAGIPLTTWQALYYILPIGSTNGSLAANFRLVGYTSDFDVPYNWVLIATNNSEASGGYIQTSSGIKLKAGQSIATGTYSTYAAYTTDYIDGQIFVNSTSNNPVAANTQLYNGLAYVSTNISLFGQTDGALYSQAYSTSWAHQIYGDYRTGQLAVRGMNNGTLQPWRVVLDSTNYTSYALANTSGVTFNGSLNFTGDVVVGANTNIASNGNINFAQSNPVIRAASYITMPGGLYVSGGTLYSGATIQARSGISNDSATYLQLNGGTGYYTNIAGRLGIGTTAAAANLEVSVVSADATVLQEVARFSTTGRSAAGGTANRGTLISFSDASNQTLTAALGGLRKDSSADYNGHLAFYTNNTGASPATGVSQLSERMRIDTGGNVMIGVTSSTNKFTVQRFSGQSSYSDMILMDGTQSFTFNSNTSPGSWNGLVGAGDHVIQFTNGVQGTGALAIVPWASTTSGLRMTATGNVGINIVTAAATLDIGTTAATSANALTTILARGSDTNFALCALTGSAGNASGQSVGKFGVRYLSTSADTASFNFYRGGGDVDGAIGINTNGSERVRIDSSGNVGIGNTAPVLKLEVNGNMSVDAFVEFDQTIATSYTISGGRNALTAGPITINSGVTVTVPSGSVWTIV